MRNGQDLRKICDKLTLLQNQRRIIPCYAILRRTRICTLLLPPSLYWSVALWRPIYTSWEYLLWQKGQKIKDHPSLISYASWLGVQGLLVVKLIPRRHLAENFERILSGDWGCFTDSVTVRARHQGGIWNLWYRMPHIGSAPPCS